MRIRNDMEYSLVVYVRNKFCPSTRWSPRVVVNPHEEVDEKVDIPYQKNHTTFGTYCLEGVTIVFRPNDVFVDNKHVANIPNKEGVIVSVKLRDALQILRFELKDV